MTSLPIRSPFPVDTSDTNEPASKSAAPAVIYLPAHADAVAYSHRPRPRSTLRFHAVALPLYALLSAVVMKPLFAPGGPEAGVGVLILAYVASFPLCFLFPIAPAALLIALDATGPYFSTAIDNALYVASFLAAGYLQWFVLVPWLVRYIRRLRATGSLRD